MFDDANDADQRSTEPRSPFKATPPGTPRIPEPPTPADATPPRGVAPVQPLTGATPRQAAPDDPFPPSEFFPGDDADLRGPGCGLLAAVGLMMLLLSLGIVGLSGLAGYRTGQRVAQANGTATTGAVIRSQIERLPGDLAAGNLEIARFRLDFLAAMTPAVAGLAEFQGTATALYQAAMATPTPTPQASETPQAEITAEITPDAAAETTESAGGVVVNGYNLDDLLEEAERAIDLGQYEDAVDLLDAVIALDEGYRPAQVRGLLQQSLITLARRSFQSLNTLAEGIFYTDRAEDEGASIGELNFEREIAALYLDGRAALDAGNFQRAAQRFGQMQSYGITEYKGINVSRLLFDQYVAVGQGLVNAGQVCDAVPPFNNALNLFADAGISAQRDAAQTACQNAIALTQTPGTPGTSGAEPTFAPVGQP
jgi:tetratricopeptide (TPR) repeat protein